MTEVTMPKLTDSMEEGRVVEWKVAVGDRVSEGDVLAEIETDKAVMELESFWAGTISDLLREDGDVVPVGEVIARIEEGERAGEAREEPEAEGTEGGAAGPVEEEAEEEKQAGKAKEEGAREEEGAAAKEGERVERFEKEEAGPEPAGGAGKRERGDKKAQAPEEAGADGKEMPLPGAHPLSERGGKESPRPAPPERREAPTSGVRASPRARKLAAEKEIDLAEVEGTGPEGRVTVEDVEQAAAGRPGGEGEGRGGQAARAAPPDRADEELPPVSFSEAEAEAEAVSFYQKSAIRRVVASKHVIPHFYLTKAVRAGRLLERKEAERERSGATVTHLILRACALALETLPEANRSYDRGRWIRWKVVHLGLAIETGAGLVVGVLRDAGGRDLSWIAGKTRELVERARAGKLSQAERTNPTFTLSSLGAFDVESFAAIINPPSALTLAVGSVVPTPVVTDGRVEAADVMHLTLSCDHRVVDGVLAAKFLGEVKRLLEEPTEL